MATYKFTVLPGVEAPLSAPALNLTNIRPTVAPAGRVKALLDRLSGTYTAFEQAHISQAFFDLADAGIMDRLDMFAVRLKTQGDSLTNWIDNGRTTQNNGATFTAGVGHVTNGTSSFIDLQYALGQFQGGDASLFGYLPPGSPGGRFFGRAGSGGNAVAQIEVGATNTGLRLNYGSNTPSAAHGGDTTDRLWSVVNIGDANIGYRDGNLFAQGTPGVTQVTPNQGIAIGKDNASFFATTVSAFGYGASLTQP
ncbi:MAG: hypothetical protein ACK4NW_01935, partial [Roseinatronobacter sp.]